MAAPLRVAPAVASPTVLAAEAIDPHARKRQRRAAAHGRAILDELEQIRREILAGDVSEIALGRLAALAKSMPAVEGLPAPIRFVIEQIRTRAAVELAKRGR